MTDDRINILEKEISKLRAELAEFRNMVVDVDNKRTATLSSLIDDVHSLTFRVMPEYTRAREQVAAILGSDTPPSKAD